jgi:hypothetical protein
MDFGFGVGNFDEILGPLGLAMIYLAAWYALSGIAFILLGFETSGRSLEELDTVLDKPRGAPVQPVSVQPS